MSAAISTVWEFGSESNAGKVYQTLQYADGSTSCDCPGWRFKRKSAGGLRTCKHTRFVEMGTADSHAQARKDYGGRQVTRKPDQQATPELPKQGKRVFRFEYEAE